MNPPPTHEAPTIAVRTVPWIRPMQGFKRRYERLHPSVQMIGLQLWLPFLFVALFVLCYVQAFHSPSPHQVPVGVVGHADAAETSGILEAAEPGGFEVTVLADADSALDDLLSADLAAIYDPDAAAGPTLYVASANGASTSQIVERLFLATSAADGVTLQVEDVATLPAADSAGTAGLYLSLVGTIGGYMIGMFVGMMGGPLRRRTRFGILLGTYVPLSLLAAVLAGPVVGAVHGHLLQLWLLEFVTMAAVGLVVNGLGYYTNRFVTGVALVIFVFLNVPASGAAMGTDLLPQPFRWLEHVVVGAGTLPILRDVLYGVGPGQAVGWWRLAAYAVVGVLLAVPGPAYARWRHRRRALLGLPAGGMMAHAQHQLMASAQATAAPPAPAIEFEDATGTAVEAEAVIDDVGDLLPEQDTATGGSAGAAGSTVG